MVEKPTCEELEKKIQELEQDLQHSEEKLRNIADTALDSIFCKDINSRYTFLTGLSVRNQNNERERSKRTS